MRPDRAAETAQTPSLSTRDLSIRFGGHVAVNQVTADFYPGTLTVIVGPNGAGKTTYFNLMSGQLAATSGSVHLGATDITRLGAARRTALGIGRAFQLTNLFPNLTVAENVRLAVQSRAHLGLNMFSVWFSHTELIERAEHYLERVALAERRATYVAYLSHGDKRKLEVAILLALEPAIMMFDEPTAGMSVDEVPVVLDLIRQVKAERKRTILLVEHKMDVVRQLADRIIVLHNGALVADGNPAEVMASPIVQQAYLGTGAPALEAAAKRHAALDEGARTVVPAQAGTQFSCCNAPKLGSRLRGNDDEGANETVTPFATASQAGMTGSMSAMRDQPTLSQHPPMSEPLLTLSGVHTHIGQYHILQGVDLIVPRGKLAVLLGRNGAGKTTTLRTVMGLWKASRGSVRFDGRDITALPTPDIAQAGIAYVPESMAVFSELTVRENLYLAARSGPLDTARLEWIFGFFPALKKFWNYPAGNLSGGQKQMVAIARAIVEPCKLLLVDEPTKGLAPAIVDNLIAAFRELKATDTTILLVEQNFSFVEKLGDTVCVMDDGRMVHSGSMRALVEDEQLQQRLLGLSLDSHQ